MSQPVTNQIDGRKNIRSGMYDPVIFNTKGAYIKADTLNFPEGFPAGLLLQKDGDFLKAYAGGTETPVGVLVDEVTIEDYKKYINGLSGGINGVNGIGIAVDFRGKFVKANITGWDANASTKLEARELEDGTVVQF